MCVYQIVFWYSLIIINLYKCVCVLRALLSLDLDYWCDVDDRCMG